VTSSEMTGSSSPSVGWRTADGLLARVLGVEDKQESLVGRIATQVARDIIEGHVQPGADLNSIDLAKRFDTSRTPVREALLMLEKEGLVEIPARRRPRAAMLPVQEVREIYLLRAELYALVARRIVEGGTTDAITRLESTLEAMRACAEREDNDGYFWNTVLFHERAAVATGDETLRHSIDALGLRVLQLRHLGMARGWRIERSLQDHVRLLQAIQERDAELAAAMNRSIVLTALQGLMKIYEIAVLDPAGEDESVTASSVTS
jgi:DNA-binding GntR family transcriptional regulator